MTPVPADPSLRFVVDDDGTALRVTVSGELDFACMPLFDALFDLGTQDVDTVEVDVGALTFCDLAGANAMTGFCSFHRHQGRAVRLVDVLPQVRRVLALNEEVRLAHPGCR